MNILILGGTAEARHLANRLVAIGLQVTTSLAGRTQAPLLPQGAVRIGPFGGVAGLCDYLRANGTERLVDATHPYAGRISGNAVEAAAQTAVPLVRFMRPPWTPLPGQEWTSADDAGQAAEALPRGAKVLLTIGHAGLDHFVARADCQLFLRVIEAPDLALPAHVQMIQSRPPYALEDEIGLMRDHGITHLVSKNSGGSQTAAKLEAAHKMGVQVLMIARPAYNAALEVADIEAVLEALNADAPSLG